MIRQGSLEKNLEALLPLVTDKTYQRCLFVVDDRSCVELLRDGDIDGVVRKAITGGLDPVRAIQLATINTAEYFRLDRLGAVAPGYQANLIVIGELSSLRIDMVFYQGRLVAATGGKVLASLGLPIAGLLSGEPLEMVVDSLEKLEQAAAHLGTKLPSPFYTLLCRSAGNPRTETN